MTNLVESANELRITRTYRAPRELVLRMWSDPNMITNWWGPYGFRTTTHEMDFRPGGTWKFTMHGPDGVDYPNIIRYKQTGPDRIEYEHGRENDPVYFHSIVELSETEGKTTMDFRMVFPTVEERQRVVEKFGADKGMVETTARLDAFLADSQAAEKPFRMFVSLPSDTEIRAVRSFRAPRELVFDAFTKAEQIRQWQSPYKYKFTECEFDARPGGKWHMAHGDEEGNMYRFHGDVIEISRPEKTVTTFEFEGFPGHVQTNTATFEQVGELTRVTIISSFKTKEERDMMLNSGMEWGMAQGYDRLETMVMMDDGSRPHFVFSRVLNAPQALVWKAWTERDRFAKWWGPKDCAVTIEEMDVQPAGRVRYRMDWKGQETMWGRFVYREIEPVDRLVFVDSFSNEKGEIARAPFNENWPLELLNVLTLKEENGKTMMRLEASPITGSQVELDLFAGFFDSLNKGFGGTFEQLESYLEEAQA